MDEVNAVRCLGSEMASADGSSDIEMVVAVCLHKVMVRA